MSPLSDREASDAGSVVLSLIKQFPGSSSATQQTADTKGFVLELWHRLTESSGAKTIHVKAENRR